MGLKLYLSCTYDNAGGYKEPMIIEVKNNEGNTMPKMSKNRICKKS